MKKVAKFKARITRGCRAVRRYAEGICTRITTEAGYADALARVVTAGVALLAPNQRLAKSVAETADALSAVVRTLLNERHRVGLHGHEDGWEVELPWA